MTVYTSIGIDSQAQTLFQKHQAAIERALQALAKREFYAHYPENDKEYGEEAKNNGAAVFQQQLGQFFSRLKQQGDINLKSEEVSPYLQEPLNITYPAYSSPEEAIEKALAAFAQWRKTTPEVRIGLLMEALETIKNHFFEIAYATMHTTGQAFIMSFQASGPHASDRALEALAMAFQALKAIPNEAIWEKPVGKTNVVVKKYYRAVPRGISLAIGCSTFPVWNSVPGIFASLATGNVVIVKPHPKAIYPLAIVVAILQTILAENGFDPHTIILAPDTSQAPFTKALAENPNIKIIDYTGSSAFGEYIESLPGKITFTEKAGVNSVIIDSTKDLNAMLQNLAFSVSLYSGQMCTCPQNFFIPRSGIKVGEAIVPYEEVVKQFVEAVKNLSTHPKAGPAICGAIQNENTYQRIQQASQLKAKVLLESQPIQNPEFPKARTATPLILEVEDRSLIAQEMFGPIVFIVPTESTEESIRLAKELAQQQGAISCGAYTTSEEIMNRIADEMAEAYTPVAFNLTGQVYINQNAAFSDFHVSGGNPAGNASFTDMAFVAKRFVVVESKVNAN
ncbi:MAG: phenylacetic acid degradation protein PaaN [Bacteroidia bacterium]|nr:phenylacetic acid degradation protein PaaN [Bacteroidia bacterium]MDW8159080.1 phenylacetic acid degradation protein PaaN [Bacteroidia bacterium]